MKRIALPSIMLVVALLQGCVEQLFGNIPLGAEPTQTVVALAATQTLYVAPGVVPTRIACEGTTDNVNFYVPNNEQRNYMVDDGVMTIVCGDDGKLKNIIVKLNTATPPPPVITLTPAQEPAAVYTNTDSTAPGSCGKATPLDWGGWEAKDHEVSGPAIVNVGFPGHLGNFQWRTWVAPGDSVKYVGAAGSAYQYPSNCSLEQVLRELVEFAGGLTIASPDILVSAGLASR